MAAASLYSPFQRFVIHAYTQFEKDYKNLQSHINSAQALLKPEKTYEEFLSIFRKFIAFQGDFPVYRDEIVFLTEPFPATLQTYLLQRLGYVSDLVELTLGYDIPVEREQAEKELLNGKVPKGGLAKDIVVAAGAGFINGFPVFGALGIGLAAAEHLLRDATPEETQKQIEKNELVRKINERTKSVVILHLEALYHNLKANQREKTWAARHAVILAPAEPSLGLERSEEKKRQS